MQNYSFKLIDPQLDKLANFQCNESEKTGSQAILCKSKNLFFDVEMSHIAVMVKDTICFHKYIEDLYPCSDSSDEDNEDNEDNNDLNEDIKENNNNEKYIGLSTTGLGPCIGMTTIGKNKKGETVQSISHITDLDFDQCFFDELIRLMATLDCHQFETCLFGGNKNTESLRQSILSTAIKSKIEIKNCQKNISTDENYWIDIFILDEQVKFQMITIPEPNLSEVAIVKNPGIPSKVQETHLFVNDNPITHKRKLDTTKQEESQTFDGASNRHRTWRP